MQIIVKTIGAVTALALSHDHTFIAVGHIYGHIQLFDLSKPGTPARTVVPTNVAAVSSGRQEGHLLGSRIVNIGFIAGRHTAIVSADDKGLAFYHSLGKVLFVEASDVIRILGRYDDGVPSNGIVPGSFHRKIRTPNTILAMAPLPLGTVPHPTDTYNVIAIMTPSKLVIVGLKPAARTWLKRPRSENGTRKARAISGALSWWPSMHAPTSAVNGSTDNTRSEPTNPQLAYSWGNMCHLLRVSEKKIKQTVENRRTGRSIETDVGTVAFEDVGVWTVQDSVLGLQWLNANVCYCGLDIYIC